MDSKARRKKRSNRPQRNSEPAALVPVSGVETGGSGLTSGWLKSPFFLASASNGLLWAALPPLDWWPLAWIAPIFWLMLITVDRMPGRRPYLALWGASVLYWMVVMQGIRLAHWANYFGLLALGCYLGIYLPFFIAVARWAIHRWKLPLILVAPLAWTGVELIRGYGPLGFSMALLAHTQVSRLPVIQISDLFGAYAVSFVVMLVATSVFSVLPHGGRKWSFWPIAPACIVMMLTLGYGFFRLGEPLPGEGKVPPIRVALIQGSFDTTFDDDRERPRRMLEQYSDLTLEAVDKFHPLDLAVWPETMFPVDDLVVDETSGLQLEPPFDELQIVRDNIDIFQRLMANGVRRLNPPAFNQGDDSRPAHWLLGATTREFGDHPPRRYNAAILVDENAQVVDRYFKMHPVIFGEYVPFGNVLPHLYDLFPLHNGLTPGKAPAALDVAHLTLCPSICFESLMPHLIRWHVVELTRQGRSPDVLVNLTNDGWFWGSSILDMQLDCGVFRAVELRRPMIVAANTGFSAWIDGSGVILAQGPRRELDVLLAEVVPDGRSSLYERWGDTPMWFCGLFCIGAALSGLGASIRHRRISS